uniref:SS18 N-terminal domain-containing protein n=1 Tax=Scophthalmus maximus TaxID=52904 RepID=A0A8D2ZCV9_SCOMX
MLDENHHLIQCIMDYQSKGKTAECTQYQQILHRNLVYLATIADSNQNMQSLLPAVSFFALHHSSSCSSNHLRHVLINPFLCSLTCVSTFSLPVPVWPRLLEGWVRAGDMLRVTSMTPWPLDRPPRP